MPLTVCVDVAEVVDKREHEGQTEFYVHYQEREPSLYRLAGAAAFAVLFCVRSSQSATLPSPQGDLQAAAPRLCFEPAKACTQYSAGNASGPDCCCQLQCRTAWTALHVTVNPHSADRHCQPLTPLLLPCSGQASTLLLLLHPKA